MRSLTHKSSTAEAAQAEAPEFEKVVWYREPHLRRLYCLSIFLLVGSATTGYDGMMVNTSQQINKWAEYFPEAEDENKLGILINMYNIGSILSFFIVPYMADTFGRKRTILVGCTIMVIGAMLGAFCNGYGSEFNICRRPHFANCFQCTSQDASCLGSAIPCRKCARRCC